jgi:hypothetical protein
MSRGGMDPGLELPHETWTVKPFNFRGQDDQVHGRV